MKNIVFFLVALIFLFTNCKKEDISDVSEKHLSDNSLLGSWSNAVYTDTIVTYYKVDSLTNHYGFTLKANGKFIERKNIGWCGTPPIVYGNYEGNWTLQDSVLKIETEYWGGKANYSWRLIKQNADSLVIAILKTDYQN